ncbi:MFS transporter [Saccharopolyspora sp. 5N102]|uniref:MFS transporter n=1 Tax=Saccharopolyspora sp. 5N102 TaxID=3375155 RepID=UPI00378DEBEE
MVGSVVDRPAATRQRTGLVLTALIIGVVSFQLNATMVTPAMPDIARTLGTTTDLVGLSQTMFLLIGGLAGVVLSRLSDHVGRRKVLVISLLVMSAGSLIAMLAPNIGVLIAARVLQGASGATFQLTYLILRDVLSPKQFGQALGLVTAINGGVGGLDGLAGGALADTVGFRAVFAVILGLGVIAALMAGRFVPETHAGTGGRMDWAGAVALTGALAALNLGISQGNDQGWLSPLALGLLIGGAVLLAVFWRVENRVGEPLMAARHLRSRQVWPLVATTLLALTGVFCAINFTVVLLSQDEQLGYGMNATLSALMFLAPPAVIGLASGPVAGWLAPRVGWRLVLRVGLALSIASLVFAAAFADSRWLVFAAFIGLGIGYNGLVMTTLSGLGVVLSPKESPGALPGMNGAAFGIGASLGIGIVAPTVDGGDYHTALWISVAVTALALVASFLIKPPSTTEGENI